MCIKIFFKIASTNLIKIFEVRVSQAQKISLQKRKYAFTNDVILIICNKEAL